MLDAHIEWSARTFGPGPRTQGLLKHIRKELIEIEAAPLDPNEWIDVAILALDGAWRSLGRDTYPPVDLAMMVWGLLRAKYQRNFARQWPDWRAAPPDAPIEHVRGERIYISGPMKGYPEHNFPAFHAAAAELRAKGLDVVNPAEINPSGGTWHECMRADIKALCDCTTLVLLPGWPGSEGAQLELHVAHRLGLRISTIEEYLK